MFNIQNEGALEWSIYTPIMTVTSRSTKTHDVHIFMALHNGERWLAPQLESILGQTGTSCTWTITDDASSDTSVSIVKSRIPQDRMTINSSKERMGLPDVFLNMLKSPTPKHDFYALSDQDDVWLPEKLDLACTALSSIHSDRPALWVSSITKVSKGEGALKLPAKKPSIGHALVEGLAPGCSMVWNSAFQEQLVIPDPAWCQMHDRWIYLSACILGTVIVEPEPMVEYRIHDDNAVGHSSGLLSRTRRFFEELRGSRVSMERQAQGLLDSYAKSLTPLDKELVKSIADGSRFKRIRYLVNGKLRRDADFDNLLLFARLLIFLKASRDIDSPND